MLSTPSSLHHVTAVRSKPGQAFFFINMSTNDTIHHPAVNGTSPNSDSHGQDEPQALQGSPSGSSGTGLQATGNHAKMLKVLDELQEEVHLDEDQGAHSLTKIIVCGAQSSGKSSVLEAITGIPFPRKSTPCTRCKTRVTFLRKPVSRVGLRIIPESDRPPNEARLLGSFVKDLDRSNLHDSMPRAMDEAHKLIFSGSKADKVFSYDILSITISGPNEQELELLDLPGLILSDNHDGGTIKMVRKMVVEEIQNHSIVLAVVNAIDDLERHEILAMCKEYRVDRGETLAVLTMPDRASERQAAQYVRIMRGEDHQLKKALPVDWHVLVNRDDQDLARNSSTEDRDNKERIFFETQTPWNQVKLKDRGIVNLRKRLSISLFDIARRELTQLTQQLRRKLQHLEGDMKALGGDLNDEELRNNFKHSIRRLRNNVRDHARGKYESNIYKYEESHKIHLRSRVIEEGDLFRDEMLRFGHSWDLEGRLPAIDPDADLSTVFRPLSTTKESSIITKSREEAIKYFADLISSMRKKGLPGSSNEEVMHKVFGQISDPWAGIAKTHVDRVFECCAQYFRVITPIAFSRVVKRASLRAVDGFGNHEVVADRYFGYYLIPALEKLRLEALEELDKLDDDRMDTCQNFERYLIKIRGQREQRGMRHTLKMLNTNISLDEKTDLDDHEFAKTLNTHTPESWTLETAEDLLDAVWAHYGVSSVLL